MISVELDQDLLSQGFLPILVLRDLVLVAQKVLLEVASKEWEETEPIGHDYQHGQTVS
jgi:hypothetical protein